MLQLSGIIPPVVTPLLQHDQLDTEAVSRVVNHLIDGGVSGLFVLGTTGEGPSLTYQIRYEMVEVACEAANGRVPVLIGVTDSSLAESIHLSQHAASCGASAIVAAAPFYFPTTQAALLDWFTMLADESPLPLLLYNMPSCVGIHLDLATVKSLSGHANIIGIKDSSGNLPYFVELCELLSSDRDFVVFMGPEELIPEAVAAGADGGVCGGANLLPHVYVELFNASKAGDELGQTRLRQIVDRVFNTVYRDANGQMNLIPALKLAMHYCGLCSKQIAPPLPNVAAEHVVQLQRQLPELLSHSGSALTAEIISA